jgi:hypothetical protein
VKPTVKLGEAGREAGVWGEIVIPGTAAHRTYQTREAWYRDRLQLRNSRGRLHLKPALKLVSASLEAGVEADTSRTNGKWWPMRDL